VTDGAPTVVSLVVPPPAQPLAVARRFLNDRYVNDDDLLLLRSHRGTLYAWADVCWAERDERTLRAQLYTWLENAVYEHERDGALVPWAPTRAKITNVVDAVHAATHLDASVTVPAWLDGRESQDATAVVSLKNGFLTVATRELQPHTPALFIQHSLPFAYDPEAPEPTRWLHFLGQLWPDDDQSIETLQEETGYLLGGDTSQQKMFLIVGPKRSGKGTTARILTGLLGADNVAAPTLSSLTSNFGLAPLIGKPLAIVSDARLSARANTTLAVERLLSISGEDSMTVDRKYMPSWTGRFPTRILILTNELPRFADSSGALASRFVLLVLTTSFYGKEDPALTARLLEEAPGIFNWALAGLDRLNERGYFIPPHSAEEALRQFEDLSSPVGAFIRDEAEVGLQFETDTNALFEAWKAWCSDEGRDHPGTKATFVRDLRAVVPTVTPSRRREGRDPHRLVRHVLKGIRLRPEHSDEPPPTPAQPSSRVDGQGWAEVGPTADPALQLLNPNDHKSPQSARAELGARLTEHRGERTGTCLVCDEGVYDKDMTFGAWDGTRWRFSGYTLPGSAQLAALHPQLCREHAIRVKFGLLAPPTPTTVRDGRR
jgi:putative DNA primase/helicase